MSESFYRRTTHCLDISKHLTFSSILLSMLVLNLSYLIVVHLHAQVFPFCLNSRRKNSHVWNFPQKRLWWPPFTDLSVFEISRLTGTGKGSYFQLARIESLMSLLIRLLLVSAALCFILALRRNESTALGLKFTGCDFEKLRNAPPSPYVPTRYPCPLGMWLEWG